MPNKLQLKINFDALNYKSGDIIKIDCTEDGIPLDKFWRDRLQDSKRDKCVEVVSNESKKQEPKEQTEKSEKINDDSGKIKKPSKKGKG